mgnify:CR=1 FL=1
MSGRLGDQAGCIPEEGEKPPAKKFIYDIRERGISLFPIRWVESERRTVRNV